MVEKDADNPVIAAAHSSKHLCEDDNKPPCKYRRGHVGLDRILPDEGSADGEARSGQW